MHPSPPALEEEAFRLKALRDLLVLDSGPEALFDALTRQAAEACGMPIALISLIDEDRQWFKANLGLPGLTQTPRDQAFCAWTIAADKVLEVPDATADPRFAQNPLVTGDPEIRFYAGAPLNVEGARVGSLCVIDRAPHSLSTGQLQALRNLAELASLALAAYGRRQQVLAAAEARYKAVVDAQLEMVSLAREDGSLAYVNPAYARHFGQAPQAMVGSSLFDHVAPQDRAAVRSLLDEVLHSGVTARSENRMTAADGSIRWVAWTNRPHDDPGQPRMLHSVGRDITERKQAELALRESEALLEQTGRLAGVGGWALDLASSRVSWTAQTRLIHEVAPDFQPSLQTAISFYAPEGRQAIEAAVQRAMAEGQPWDLELPLVTATGRPIWVRAIGEVEFVEGRPARLLGSFQDLTEQRRLRERIAASERFLQKLSDVLPLRMAYLDADLRYRFANAELLRQLERQADDVIGRTRAELMSPGAQASVIEPSLAALRGEPQRFEFEEIVGGKRRRFESRLVPDQDASGHTTGFFAIGIDITERSAAEQALRELSAILEHTTDFVVQADTRGRLVYANPAARQALGLAIDDPLDQRRVSEFNPPATSRLLEESAVPAVARGEVWLGQAGVLLAGRGEVPVSYMLIGHRDAQGRIERYSAVMRDVSQAVAREQEILRQSATLRSVADAMPAIVSVLDEQGRYRFVNAAFERWYGQPAANALGLDAREVLGEAEYARRAPWIERALAGETVTFDLAYPGSATHQAISYIPLRLPDGRTEGMVVVGQDVTGHKREAARLLQLAQHDPLTGLLNRAGFEQALQSMRDMAEGRGVALLYIDMDRFKPVNDRHGHAVGDQLLKIFAQRLLGLVRPTDAVARLGGDEFGVALIGLRDPSNADFVADKLLAAAHEPFIIERLRLQVGASVGVAYAAQAPDDWQALLAIADAQLLRAKAGGRGRRLSTAGATG